MLQANPTFDAWAPLRSAFAAAEKLAYALEERLKRTPPLPAEAIAETAQTAFTAIAASARNPAEFRRMEYLRIARDAARTRARQRDDDLKLYERWIAVLEEKLARARDKLNGTKPKGGLTPETLLEIERAAKLL